jgi:DNA-binding phage protein
MTRQPASTEFQLLASFEAVRTLLLSGPFADRLDKPLAYWSLPSDRRLPLAFMARTVGELLGTPFDQLSATPGIGLKKIRGLLALLDRAAEPTPAPVSDVRDDFKRLSLAPGDDGAAMNPDCVSEAAWSEWRSRVMTRRLGQEPLGRFAASLQSLPRVIWSTPLAAYTDLSLAEVRALRTYGEKRVHAVLDVFGALQPILAAVDGQPHLDVRIRASLIVQIEQWIERTREDSGLTLEHVAAEFVEPLLRQLAIDGGEQVQQLARARLGLTGKESSIRQLARQMGLTRARIYQLLDDVQSIVQVRWPDGKRYLSELCAKFKARGGEPGIYRLLDNCRDLCNPQRTLPMTRPAVEEQTVDGPRMGAPPA